MTDSHTPRSATGADRAGDLGAVDHERGDQRAGAHGEADAQGADAEHGEDGHTPDTLGPIDWTAWGVGAAGVAIGLLIAAGFALSTGYLGG